MRTLSMLLLGSAALALVSQIAGAADMKPILKAPPPPPPSSYSWNGFYIGAHIGVGMSRDIFDPTLDNFPSPFSGFLCGDGSTQLCPGGRHNAQGLMGGGQAGINIQRGAALFGIEGTYSAADIKGRHSYLTPEFTLADSFFGTCCDGFTTVSGQGTTTTRVKALASLTGRLGLVSWPQDRALFYVKGGAAYMRQDITNSHTTSYAYCTTQCAPDGSADFSGSRSRDRWGYVVGTGVELALSDKWTGKVEYNFMDFGRQTVNISGLGCVGPASQAPDCGSASISQKVATTIHTITFGLNYRISSWVP